MMWTTSWVFSRRLHKGGINMQDYIAQEDVIRIGRYLYKVVLCIGRLRILRLL